jgi:hypothetical protein
MIRDDHDLEDDPLIKALWEALEAGMKRDDDEIERIEKRAQDAKQKLEDGNKWPDR